MPLVIANNEENAGDFNWNDEIGSTYHFPNRYKNKIISEKGREFIYYRGTRRKDNKKGNAEYFGIGTFGNIWEDIETKSMPPKDKIFYCEIINYIEFKNPVSIKNLDGDYYEDVKFSNHWGTGVRTISDEVFRKISYQANIYSTPQVLDNFSLSIINKLEQTPPEKHESKSKNREGTYKFKNQLLEIYSNKCSISKEITIDVLEGAHIHPYINKESNHMQNGILLRVDIHRLFDKNLISIDKNYKIHVSERLNDTVYYQYNGKKITLPFHESFYPSKDALELKHQNFKKL